MLGRMKHEESERPKQDGLVTAAASILGKLSWSKRRARFNPEELREQLSDAGKLGGRPRAISEPKEST